MKSLKEVLDLIQADDDQSVADLYDLMRPDQHSDAEMQAMYEDALGYDPTTFFEKREMANIANRIMDSDVVPEEASTYVRDNFDDIVTSSYEAYQENKPIFQQAAVEQCISERVGIDIDLDVPDAWIEEDEPDEESVDDEEDPDEDD